MLSNTIISLCFNIIISIIIIVGVHYFWNYLKETYTTKKTRDLVNIQIDKYKKILNDIQNNENNKIKDSKKTIFETEEEKQSMNDDLMNFLNEQTK
jgi:predicted PurR-regulated permease PerM